MSGSVRKEYDELVNRFISGKASEEDMKVLELYFNLFDEQPDITEKLNEDQLLQLGARLRNNIKSGIQVTAAEPKRNIVPLYIKAWLSVAAAVLIFAGLAAFFMFNRPKANNNNKLAAVRAAKKSEPAINKYVTLMDGTRVLIHAGSKLLVGRNFSGQGNREVTLAGEAYFDVKHNSRRKFIIHIGDINVTVLGTAFNIKAYPTDRSVAVTVTRGRVKVEKNDRLLAILVPNEQLIAAAIGDVPKATEHQVIAQQFLQWAGADMIFDGTSFGELADRLNKRYDVHITFGNPNLSTCPITGSFSGIESLKEVLEVVSATRGTTYKIKGNEIKIDGKGCNGQ